MRLLTRRAFVAGAGATVATAAVAWHYSWLTRRALLRLGLIRPPVNLLRNAGFLACTNAGVPDYWGTDGADVVGDLGRLLSIVDDSPVSGARAWHVQNPVDGYELQVMAATAFVPDEQPYTLSVFLRSDRPTRLLARLGWSDTREIVVGSAWRRVEMTAVPRAEAKSRRALEARFSLPGPGAVWLAAPQLERAARATPFSLALIDDHPLPAIPWADDRQSELSRNPTSIAGGAESIVGIAVEHPTQAAFHDIRQHGFDAVVLFVPPGDGLGDVPRWLDEAASQGLRVIACFLHAPSAGPADVTARSLQIVRALKGHPAILGWLFVDEPSRRSPSVDWAGLSGLRAIIRDEDPVHPAFVNDLESAALAQAVAASDVGCVDVYPIGHYRNALKAVADASMQVNDASAASGKPSAMFLPFYGYHDAAREPTVEEARAMAYLTYIHGTRTILFWNYRPVSSGLWSAVGRLREELARLDRLAASGACLKRIGTCARQQVHFAIWESAETCWLVAVNAAPDAVRSRVSLAGLSSAALAVPRAWYGGTAERVRDGGLDVSLPALARQVYELPALSRL